ncbi:lysophospholipid acyltransferase family protein [Treponema sp.]|uniref:lysophospholipid acyltransferase family protein n=1 Tax=Treponema sp. TaxID=166 RepID=UPI00388F508A
MLSLITVLCEFGVILPPTLLLCLVYPFSRRAAVAVSNYITCVCARQVFAVLKMYRQFNFLGDYSEMDRLPEQFIVISNHQSLFDIVAYLKFFGGLKARFVAKDNLAKVPMVGKMLKSQQHCMIPRKGSPSVAMKSIDRFGVNILKKKQYPVIFPEGTRSKDGNLNSFYSAGFRRLVAATRLPVAVCALDGGWKISNMDSIFKNLRRGAYRVKVLKIYDAPKDKEEEKKILEESRELIQNQLDVWRKLPENSLEV